MLRLFVLRHAKAERSHSGVEDHARVLDERGRAQMAVLGAHMAKRKLSPQHVIVSPAARTRETWELLRPHLPAIPSVSFESEIYNAMPQDIVAAIKQAPPTAKSVMVVGHNPGLHEIAVQLSGGSGRDELREGLPTSGLVIIDFDAVKWSAMKPGEGTLVDFVTPDTLAGKGSARQ